MAFSNSSATSTATSYFPGAAPTQAGPPSCPRADGAHPESPIACLTTPQSGTYGGETRLPSSSTYSWSLLVLGKTQDPCKPLRSVRGLFRSHRPVDNSCRLSSDHS